jgi:hypothetical protein
MYLCVAANCCAVLCEGIGRMLRGVATTFAGRGAYAESVVVLFQLPLTPPFSFSASPTLLTSRSSPPIRP